MKKVTAILAVAVLTLGASAALAGMAPKSGVVGSFHDIGSQAAYQQDDLQRICIFCHTPHNAATGANYTMAPLWNRDYVPTVNTTYSWVAPANQVVDGLGNSLIPMTDPLIGPTRLCMTCHDGVTAVDQHGPAAGLGTAQLNHASGTALASAGRAWSDLSNTHPVGFLYSAALTQRTTSELVDPDAADAKYVDQVDALGIRANFTYFGDTRDSVKFIKDGLYGGFVTCASCHEVHNKDNATNPLAAGAPAGSARNYFLRATERGSALCLSCHVK